MAAENKPNSAVTAKSNSNKKRKHYRPNNKPVKKKGAYPLRPGVQGFFITCDGGRERQASDEAINVIDSFYEELVYGRDSHAKFAVPSDKPLNKKIKFVYSDDDEEEDDDEDDAVNDERKDSEEEKKLDTSTRQTNAAKTENTDAAKTENAKSEKSYHPIAENACNEGQAEENTYDDDKSGENAENQTEELKDEELKEPSAKKQCIAACVSNPVSHVEQKSIDKLIEDELKELADKSKRRFFTLDSGCNGVVFIQMRKEDGDPSPKDIAQHMMTSVALTKKHMSRFILRVLPVEVSCYSSEEEISKAMLPIVEKYFPSDSQDPHKFAVLYEARANTGIDRMKIINAVAKSVPGPHKVDLSNPDKTIVVEIVKTVCLIGVVEKYKELAKYNLRQLTSPK